MRSLTLRQNFVWTLTGQILYAASQWGVVTLLARQGTSAMIGEYALALAIAGPVVTFLNMKLRGVQATDAQNQYEFSDYLGLRILTSLLATLLIALVAMLGDREPEVRLTILVFALAKAFESVSDILFGLQQKHERMDIVGRSNIAKGVLTIAAFAFGFWVTGKVSGGVVGIALAWMSTLLIIDIPNATRTLRVVQYGAAESANGMRGRRNLRPRFRSETIKSLILLALPLAFTVTLGSLATNVPRYFVEYFLGQGELGVFAAMVYPLVASGLVVSSLAQSTIPRLAMYYQYQDFHGFRSLLTKLILFGALIGVAGVVIVSLIGEQIITLLYGRDYAEYDDLFLWVMINGAVGYLYIFLGTALTAMRLFRVQLPIHVFSLTLLILMCTLLVRPLGLNGAVIALLSASMSEAILYAAVVYRRIRDATVGHTAGD